MRVDLTPKLEISSRACVRVAGLARSTGASKVMVCECDACAALGRAAATSAQRQRARGAIRDMSGGREGSCVQPFGWAEGCGAARPGVPRPTSVRRPCPSPLPRPPDDCAGGPAGAERNERPPLLVVEPLRAFLDEHGLGAGDPDIEPV